MLSVKIALSITLAISLLLTGCAPVPVENADKDVNDVVKPIEYDPANETEVSELIHVN